MKAFIPVNVAMKLYHLFTCGRLQFQANCAIEANYATFQNGRLPPSLTKKNSVRLFEVSTRQAPANSRNYSQDVNSYLPPSRSGLVVECVCFKRSVILLWWVRISVQVWCIDCFSKSKDLYVTTSFKGYLILFLVHF